jgi:fluoroquinolone transport system permease protein
MERVLVLVIFNDPALLGFLFVGVMHLFEKNENTLQAMAVTPMQVENYILSKSIALTLISLFCCYLMVISAYGTNINFVHFTMATIFATMIFSMIGFVTVAGQESFNKYLLRALGVILFLTIPFLGYFDVLPEAWFWIFPTQPAIKLYTLAFTPQTTTDGVLVPYALCGAWTYVSFLWAKHTITRKLTEI